MSGKGAKGLSLLARVSRLCGDRYCNNQPSVSWTKDSVKTIVDSITISKPPNGAVISQDGTAMVIQVNAREVTKPRPGLGLYKPQALEPIMPIQDFVGDFLSILELETKEMSFDYFLMHRICWKLLRRTNELCRPQITELYGAGYLPSEKDLPLITEYIFQNIVADDEASMEDLEAMNPMLSLAKVAFEETFKDEAEVVVQRSENLGISLADLQL